MHRAIGKVYGTKTKPEITMLVVQKRHHMRAFPIDKKDSDGKNNILPGTVIDKKITSPYYFQFFLTSHSAIIGTVRPAKYTVIVNDSKLNADDMQSLTHGLCHMFARCSRAVSYPNPTYMAHLLCARAKAWLIGTEFHEKMDLETEFKKRQLKPIFKVNTMFFM